MEASPAVLSDDHYLRTIVTYQHRSADLEADWTTHVVWHHWTDPTGLLAFDYTGHATNVANVFAHGTGGATHFDFYSLGKVTTKVYEMQEMKPREVKGTASVGPTPSWDSTFSAPRELCVPLRYYAGRNLKGLRGRLFLGPLAGSRVEENVDVSYLPHVLDLATALAAIGGANTSWCLHSDKNDVLNGAGSPGGTTVAAWHDITYAWVNDQWAHMESREKPETTRQHVDITPGIP